MQFTSRLIEVHQESGLKFLEGLLNEYGQLESGLGIISEIWIIETHDLLKPVFSRLDRMTEAELDQLYGAIIWSNPEHRLADLVRLRNSVPDFQLPPHPTESLTFHERNDKPIEYLQRKANGVAEETGPV